jgi:predicted outer membrane repeat protein
VCPSGCSYAHIQDAVNAAASGDTIDIWAGTYAEHLDIEKSLTLLGGFAGSTIVDGSNSGTVATIGLSNTAALVTLSGVTIQHGNRANGYGGGIVNAGSLDLANSLVMSNTVAGYLAAVNSAGGIYSSGTLTLTNSNVVGNSGGSGGSGGISNTKGGTVVMTNSTVSGNSASYGGGILNYGTLTLSNSTVSGNIGGGIDNPGTLTLSNSTVSDNSSSYNSGGGIYSTGTLTLSNSTVSGNSTAGGSGGGIFAYGTLTLSNSTISGNSATSNGGSGGGILSAGTLTLSNSTISGNSASAFGGGIDSAGRLTLSNTILAGNNAGTGPDCSGSLTSGGYNLVGIGDGCSGLTNGVNGDQVGTGSSPLDPRLDPLYDYGGPTQTMPPQPGSPALDAVPASNCVLTTDQRGQPRPDEAADNGACDIGAVEGTEPSATVGLSTNSLDFGTQLVGTTSAPRAVTITNTGTVPLGFFDIYESGPDFQDFYFDPSSTCDYSIPVLPGSSCIVALVFSPAMTETAGTSSATLYIYDNTADSPQVVSLSGNRTSLPAATPTTVPVLPTSTATPTTAPVLPSPTATPTKTPLPPTATSPAPPAATPIRITPPTSAPSAAPAPPIATEPPSQPTAVQAICPIHLAAPLSVGIAPHSAVASSNSLALALSRTPPSVTGGGRLPLTIHAAPHAAITASLDVVATQVVTHGKGAHRTRTTRRIVLYHTALHGSADAHGRFTAQMPVAYQPLSPVVATLTVRATTPCSTATRQTPLTVLPLRIVVTPGRVAGGGTLTIVLRTGRAGHVSITLEVAATRETIVGQGTQRHHVRQRVVLYRLLVSGTADRTGRFARRVRIAYRPGKALAAGLTVTVRLPRGTALGRASVLIVPHR